MYKIDSKKCIGCKTCVLICPKIFRLKENYAIVIGNQESESGDLAIKTCPAQAITKDDNSDK